MGLNLTSLGLQYVLLRGSLFQLGDTVYRLPYTNQAGIANINGGVTALNNKLTSTSGDILVFGYSEGAQVATKWLRQYGKNTPVTPASRLQFLLIGNAERRYGGFAYKHQNLATICDVDGLPDPLPDGTSTVPYKVTDFARQYDGFADFPSATDIQQAVDSVGAALSDPLNWALRALQDVVNATIGAHKDAALNAVLGMQMVHTNYFSVTPGDIHNVRFTDPDHPLVEYVWSPTYPVPLLGISPTFPSLDRDKRKLIEQAYSRPVVMPQPNYPQISMFTTDFFGTDDDFRRVDETGWWPELHDEGTGS
ncbi:PE-PPE domain-containing protein [Mycobacterium sp. CSUR Q5927]|nr:PE-PPE domain-containing protein [Mycobacterium sp. CSUR Q5927]